MVRRRRNGPAPVNHRRRRVLVGALSVVAVAALVVAGYGWWSYSRVDRVDLDLAKINNSEPQNYLIVGSDSRAGVSKSDPHAGAMLGKDAPGGQRSDSIAVLRVDPASDRIDVLSIPRDLWVTLPDGKKGRINAAYATSVQALIDTIADNLDVPIHHFVEVDFTGFQKLIDSLGGVPMYFDAPVRDNNSGLRISEPGCLVLDGTQGLAFARSRHLQYKRDGSWHTDGSGDLGRMTRQQLLMRAALGRARSMGLNNVGRLKGLVDAGLDSTKIDSALGLGDILALGKRFSDFDPQRLQTHALAVEAETTSGGAAVLQLDAQGSAGTLALFRGTSKASTVTTTTVPPPEPGDVKVSIYNGGGVDGEGRRVSYVLSAGGFGIGEVDSADMIHRTTVAHAPGGEAMAKLVAAWLGPAPRVVEDKSLKSGEVHIVLGTNFTSVNEPASVQGGEGDVRSTPGTDEVAAPGSAGSVAASTTTTTVAPGWTPGVAPAGVDCG